MPTRPPTHKPAGARRARAQQALAYERTPERREKLFKMIPAGRWAGYDVCVIASGPSLTREDVAEVRLWRGGKSQEGEQQETAAAGAAERIATRRVIVVNTTYQMARWADALYACDFTWWKKYFPEVATQFPGELWSCDTDARDQMGVNWIRGRDHTGLSTEPGVINHGKNSGYQAIGLAYLFGAKKIVMLGFDMALGPSREAHWHGNHPPGLGNGGVTRYPAWRGHMDGLAADLKKTSCRVINASRRTSLKSFKRSTLHSAIYEL